MASKEVKGEEKGVGEGKRPIIYTKTGNTRLG